MNVLMLGWEYPPHIAGGLGTACEGLTQALAQQSVRIQFVLPYISGDETANHMVLVDAFAPIDAGETNPDLASTARRRSVRTLLRAYWSEEEYAVALAEQGGGSATLPGQTDPKAERSQYGQDIFGEVARYAESVMDSCEGTGAEVIHAHDWMTFPAAVALKRLTGKPLVVHVHSLECDRSGHNGMNRRIYDLEREGIHNADAVVAVSHYTKDILCREYGADLGKVHVVHNGIYPKQVVRHYREKHPDFPEHVVLFLGRVTFQKGPDYFVRAAAKIIPHVPDALFVLAGAGDMLEPLKRVVADLGMTEHFHFPGFLRGTAVEEMFSVADLYVMPSVSEPFGISTLEAINFNVPVLVSKQSGVAEVVSHGLKFDFWDTDRLADLMINGLVHEELRADMIDMARDDLEKLRWDASAARTVDVYRHVLQ